jgi:hypothetical protein
MQQFIAKFEKDIQGAMSGEDHVKGIGQKVKRAALAPLKQQNVAGGQDSRNQKRRPERPPQAEGLPHED